MFDERRQAYEESVRQRILDVLEGVVGAGGARVQVSAELDRRSVTQSVESYDPDGQVIESRQTSEELTQDQEGRDNRVSASENLPDDGEAQAADGPVQSSSRERNDETINYLNSRTTRTEVIEAGSIERLSVAVAVDYAQSTNEEGVVTYQPRSAEEMENLRALVRSAMGYDETRDVPPIVEQMEFARVDTGLGTPAVSGFSLDKNDIMRAAEIGVLFITAILIIFLVARPLVRGAQGMAVPALATAGAPASAAVAGPPAPSALPSSGAAPAALPQPGASAASAGPIEEALDIAKIDGQVKASSVKKVAGIVEQHPEESISILRTWLHES